MKKKLMIGLAALALATGIGAAAGIKASASNNDVMEAKAAPAYDKTITVYFDGVSGWNIPHMYFSIKGGGDYDFTEASVTSGYDATVGQFKCTLTGSSLDTLYCKWYEGSLDWHPVNQNYNWNVPTGDITLSNGGVYVLKWTGNAGSNGNSRWYNYQFARLETAYFVDGNSWNNSGSLYAHSFNDNGHKDKEYPGRLMTDTGARIKTKMGDVWYSIKVFKAPVLQDDSSNEYDKIVFTGNDDARKTTNLTYGGDNSIQFWNVAAEGGNTEIVRFLLSILSAMNTATVNDVDYVNSVCGISDDDALSINSAYNTFVNTTFLGNSDMLKSLNESEIVTYNPNEWETGFGSGSNTPVFVEDIVDQINTKRSPKYGTSLTPAALPSGSTSTIIAVSILGFSAIAFAGYAVYRKKHQAE